MRVASASGTSDEESFCDKAFELLQRPWLGQPGERRVITRRDAIMHSKPLAYHADWIVRPAIGEDPAAAPPSARAGGFHHV